MHDLLQKLVTTALKSAARHFPSMRREMEADGFAAYVTYSTGVLRGDDQASVEGAKEAARIVARVCDFPELTVRSFVTLDGEPHVITSLKEIGGAAWRIGVSDAMSESSVAVYRDGMSFTVPALVSRVASGVMESDPYSHPSQEVVFVVVRASDWADATPPAFGDIIETQHFGRVTAQQIVRGASYWTIEATRNEQGGAAL